MRNPSRPALLGLGCLLLSGCALINKADAVIFRYFTPAGVAPASTADSGKGRGVGLELRLGRVNAATYFKDRIVHRDETREVTYYDELRWTEKPEDYLRRAIGRALFEVEGMRELVGRPGATLEIVLDAFDELRAPRHVAHVEVTWLVRDEQAVRLQHSFSVERPIADVKQTKRPNAIAEAMADALAEAVSTIADGVVNEMSGRHAAN